MNSEAMLPRIALTAVEPAGIGPELAVKLAASDIAADLVVLADPDLIAAAARSAGVDIEVIAYDADAAIAARARGSLRIVPMSLSAPATPGTLDPRNAPYVLATLARAADGAASGEFAAIVTAPVHKGVVNDAGIPFTGHTEFFAQRARREVVMMLVADGESARNGGDLRVALATTHLPLRAVADAIDAGSLARTLRIVDDALRGDFDITDPVIAVLGLNPHAGEEGHLGREEIDVIIPVIERLRAEGMRLVGPLPADTAFLPSKLQGFDAVLAMYHDQGLPVLKYSGFESAVNLTLGLPYPRVAVDHGTALDIAGSGRADPSSLLAAIQACTRLAATRRARRERA